jgi:tetratricopeptide (TPR) repeat protein
MISFRIPNFVLSILQAIFVVGCFSWAGCKPNATTVTLEQDDLKNRSMALLENYEQDKSQEGKMLTEAADGFRKLSQALPNETLGPKNLCVVLLAKIKKLDASGNPQAYAEACREFEATAQSIRKLRPDDPDADILLARYFRDKNDRERAIDFYRKAIKNPRATADIYYQLFQSIQADNPLAGNPEIRDLLSKACELAPSNIVLAVAHLNALVKLQDPHLYDSALRCTDLLRPIAGRANDTTANLLASAVEAAKKSQWTQSDAFTIRLRNTLVAELAYQNDLNLLEPHILEYVKLAFDLPIASPTYKRPSNAPTQSFQIENRSNQNSDATAIASEDFDLDGRFDLAIASGPSIAVMGLDAKGKSTSTMVQVVSDIDCTGLMLADLDHDPQFRKESLPSSPFPPNALPDAKPDPKFGMVDTDVDLIAYGAQGIRLFKNELNTADGTRSLIAVPISDEMKALTQIRTVAVIDLDHDSDLDIAVSSSTGISLWSNRGNWTFADFTPFSNLPPATTRFDSILAMDLDRNVLNDFLLGSDTGVHPVMLANNLHGRYQLRDLDWKKELEGSCRAVESIDANHDACWDVLSCGKQGTKLAMMKSMGHHSWLPDKVISLSSTPAIGLLVVDVDNDGYVDGLSWGEKGLELFRGGADGKLIQDKTSLPSVGSLVQVVAMDIDDDRDEDLVCLKVDGAIEFLVNQGGSDKQQLDIVLRADDDGKQTPRKRCPMHGVGSLIELKSNGEYQSKIVRGTRTKFGLGTKSEADVMRVVWTNGIPNNVIKLSNRFTIYDQQDLGGSCPYLYAWDGTKFEFCTDCLWSAPIGLQFAQGVAAPTREWEYLKLDGAAIKPRDGRYLLQVTEELWEAAYFDAIELMAIDHPKEIDVFTNEKVGPAELAEFRVHTVENRFIPKRVVDQNGNDVTGTVAARDQQYTRSWNRGFNQGLVEEHWLEVDMNESKELGDDLMLYLTGWVFPTCTSLNLAMTENPLRPKLHPPSIQVPDSNGDWTEVIPYAGFPGGKTKTIAIDLTGKFLCDDHRVRVVTNMELSWDELFWTRGQGPSRDNAASYRIAKLDLLRADLSYRGFSTLVPQPGNAPKRFDYQRLVTDSIWPPMSGSFTRFGDVKELVTKGDDLQVVMGAGDALTLEFSAQTEPLPEGWVRDFIIYNVGWDKDADLNTIHGQSVEPLPFRAMKRYPYEPDESFPSSPEHAHFLKQYQTRTQFFGSFWNQIRDAQ